MVKCCPNLTNFGLCMKYIIDFRPKVSKSAEYSAKTEKFIVKCCPNLTNFGLSMKYIIDFWPKVSKSAEYSAETEKFCG
jgi:hypothetical protein